MLASRVEDFAAVLGQQLLVGGDDMLAGVGSREHGFLRRLDAADQFEDDRDRRIMQVRA